MKDLSRFYQAQKSAYSDALCEIQNGRKEGHWIWFIFPQIAGLGSSNLAVWYSIQNLNEAECYAADPILGARLREITQSLLDQPCSNIYAIMGGIDAVKVRSCMTLFEIADSQHAELYASVLERFYQGRRDFETLRILNIG